MGKLEKLTESKERRLDSIEYSADMPVDVGGSLRVIEGVRYTRCEYERRQTEVLDVDMDAQGGDLYEMWRHEPDMYLKHSGLDVWRGMTRDDRVAKWVEILEKYRETYEFNWGYYSVPDGMKKLDFRKAQKLGYIGERGNLSDMPKLDTDMIYRKCSTSFDASYTKRFNLVSEIQNRYDRFVPYPQQRHFLATNYAEVLYGGARGGGKASPCGTMVCTPKGWVKIGSLRVGDAVTNPVTGGSERVIQIHPQGVIPVFRVKTDDGASVLVSGQHLWAYKRPNHRRPLTKQSSERDYSIANLGHEIQRDGWSNLRVGDTAEIMEIVKSGEHPRIPLTSPVIYTVNGRTGTGIDPYLIGLYLGDGCHWTGGITTADTEIRDYLMANGFNEIPSNHYQYNPVGQTKKQFKAWISNNGLNGKRAWEKFIPSYVFTSSLKYRLEVLRGMMDTDGYVDDRGRCYYSTTSDELAKGVIDIVRSLGGKAYDRVKKCGYKKDDVYVECRDAHDILVQLPKTSALFKLTRKIARCTDSWNGGYQMMRAIVSVEPEGEQECVCITVDSTYGLYVTEDFIVTHNSNALIIDAALHVRRWSYNEAGSVVVERQSIDYPEYSALILRRTFQDIYRNFKPMCDKVYPKLGGIWREKTQCYTFPSGATIYLGYCDSDDDVGKYIGGNFHYLGIEELNQFPERWIKDIGGSIRTTNPELIPLKRYTTNPGGLGHIWIKKRFIDACPPRRGETIYSKKHDIEYHALQPGEPVTDEDGNVRWFIPALVFDNPALVDNDPNYISMLKSLDPVKKKMWLLGDWDEMSGLFFDTWNPAFHVIHQDEFKIDPDNCRIYRCVDYGTTNPFACMFVQVDKDGRAVVFDEIYKCGLTASAQAKEIYERTLWWKLSEDMIDLTVVDPSMKTSTQDGGHVLKSVIEIYYENGIEHIALGVNARVPGWAVMKDYLQIPDFKEGEEIQRPFLVFTNNCVNCIETIPSLIRSKKDPDDLDTKSEDHAADAIRYLLMFIKLPSFRPQDSDEPKWLQELKARAGKTEDVSLATVWAT